MNNKTILVGILVILCVGAFLLWFTQKTIPPPIAKPSISPTTKPAEVTQNVVTIIQVTPNGFEPATLTVPVGTRINWVNKSGKVVSINSADHPTHLKYPPLNLGEFNDGSAVQLVFDKAGTYKYHNHYIPTQTGTVVVK